MKTQKMRGKTRRTGVVKSNKRSIHVKGKWKAIELDPSLFSEEGLEGLVCFEELTSYRLVDSEKALVRAGKELKRGKKNAKKRKASEVEEGGGEPSEEGTAETSTKPAKKKRKKKNKKMPAEEPSKAAEEPSKAAEVPSKAAEVPSKAAEVSVEAVTQKEVVADEEKGEDEAAKEDGSKDTVPDAQSQSKLTKKRKKKKPQRGKEAIAAEEQAEPELPTGVITATKKQSPQVKLPKKQQKNWTNPGLSGSVDKKTDTRAWADLFVPPPVLKALSTLGFGSPTPIQALTLPPAIRDRMDIVGAAETGSGKTLAFGIPIIHAILEWRKGSDKPVGADNNTEPGAELESLSIPGADEPANSGKEADDSPAEQDQEDNVEAEEEEVEGPTDQGQGDAGDDPSEDEERDDDERHRCVKVIDNAVFDFDCTADAEATSSRNQPLLGLVLTPTRELAVQVKNHIDAVAKFTDIKTAILVGGMAQQKQIRMLKRRPEIIIATPGRLWDLIKEKHPHLQNLRQLRCLVIDEADRMVERGHFAELESLLEMLNTVHFNPTRQIFVFSATLTMAHSLPTRVLQKKKRKVEQRSRLEVLMEKVGMRSKPKIVDLTRKEATVETLTETRINCQKDEKDFFLYYFLLQYPGRTMVFANSIDCIKRLNSLLVIMDFAPLPLHANMHQKQRLKNLERFAERERCVLLTTDVAARGLDIPNIEHVIHYQVPRTSETYVHRSGRTARATKEGLSLLLIGPDDVMNFKKIYKTLGKDEELPMFPIEIKCMEAIKERVNLARKIEKIEFHNGKEKQHNSWARQAAEALGVDLDDDMLLGTRGDEESDRQQQKMVKGMKSQLKHLISQPVFKNVIKTRYPTQMGKLALSQMPRAGAESALTKLFIQKQTLEKNLPLQQQKQKKKQQE